MKKISIVRQWVMVALFSIAANLAHPITPSFLKSLNAPDYMFGVAFAAMSITNFLCSPFWGKLSKKIGITSVLTLCYLGYSLGQFVFGSATNGVGVVVGRLLSGAFISGIMVNQLLYVMEHSDNPSKNLAISSIVGAVFLPVGYLIGGFIGDTSIPLVFNIQIVSLVVIAIINHFTIDCKESNRSLSTRQLIMDSNPLSLFNTKNSIVTKTVILFLITVFMINFAITAYDQGFNYLIRDEFNFPPSYSGMIKAVIGIITFGINSTLCIWLLKNTNIATSLIYTLVTCIVGFISVIFVRQIPFFIVVNIVLFASTAIILPLIQGLLTEISKDKSDTLVGMYNSIRSLGMVGGSLLAGYLYTIHSRSSFIIAIVLFVLAMITLSLYKKERAL